MNSRFEIIQYRIYLSLHLFLLSFIFVPTLWAGTPQQNIRDALQLMEQKEFEQALTLLNEAESAVANRDELSSLISAAYLGRGYQLLANNEFAGAQEHFREGRRYDESRPGLWQGEAMSLYKQGQYDEAAALLSEAVGLAPGNVNLHTLLGRSYYAAGRMQESIDSLTRAVELGGGEEIVSLLAKVRREWQVEREMGREVRGHFQLSFVDGPQYADLAVDILNVLEDAYAELGSELAFYPNVSVPVLIYTKQDFVSITRSPDWAGGVYDGKIRIPIGGMHQMTDRLAAILYHEYAHVLLHFMTHRNIPVWLNEGLAELFGRRIFALPLEEFSAAREKGEMLAWDKLSGPFSKLPSEEVPLAYQQSFAMVSFMAERYGWHKITELLEELGKKKEWQKAIADVYEIYGLDWPSIRAEWQASIGL